MGELIDKLVPYFVWTTAYHRDDVEPDHSVLQTVGHKVVERGLHHPALFAVRNAVRWIAPDRARAHPDLDEAQGVILLGDEIDFAIAATEISRADGVPLRFEQLSGGILAFASEAATIERRTLHL